MSSTAFFHSPKSDLSKIDSICLGSGRFLRSVLVPALNAGNLKSAIFQTRGASFLQFSVEAFKDVRNSSKTNMNDEDHLFYEIDTVNFDGKVSTEIVHFHAVGTLGTDPGKESVISLLEKMESIRVIGIGVTESGIKPFSSALVHLTDILRKCHSLITSNSHQLTCPNPNSRISVINTDNVPNNGDTIRKFVLEIAERQNQDHQFVNGQAFIEFLQVGGGVTFHNSMVDRITSQRPNSGGMVPRCEPTPDKAIVIEDLDQDLHGALSSQLLRTKYGLVVRKKEGQLTGDIALKLRIANGTHTSIAHCMALSSFLLTDVLSDGANPYSATLVHFLDAIFESQILQGAEAQYGKEETRAVYNDWKQRLCHAHFGLSTFFITQNGAAKCGLRIAPTIRALIKEEKSVTVSTIFAIAAILRFITPSQSHSESDSNDGKSSLYIGWLDSSKSMEVASCFGEIVEDTITYADGLRYNLNEGWYEFKCDCMVELPSKSSIISLPDTLEYIVKNSSKQPKAFEEIVFAFLTSKSGGDMFDLATNSATLCRLLNVAKAVSVLYARMIAGDKALTLLQEMKNTFGLYHPNGFETPCERIIDGCFDREKNVSRSLQPLHYQPSSIPDYSGLMKCGLNTDHEVILSVVLAEVASVKTIDLHTHLLPPTHGSLCLWGIDELLTYHYLVAEYFMTAPPSITPTEFYARNKRDQADLIWKALFLDRSPLSEACRGVITTLEALGLSDAIKERDLEAVRKFYQSFRDDGAAGAERFSNLIYRLSGVEYAIMTNIPFDSLEAQHWRPHKKTYSENYKSAIRVDPLLSGDRETIESALRASGYEISLLGARKYLLDWIDAMKPEYMMASTPHNFSWSSSERGDLYGVKKTGINEEAMKEPFAFVDIISKGEDINECNLEDEDTASLINENSDFLSEVLMKVCEERDLPIALKIGAHRGVNPRLLTAGDGMVAFADGGVLARLCSRFPRVRFLATFLSKNNQHEACVLASKFRNLHIYGCWWYCNNPSIIKEITEMRLEMLGTAFTSQHSDARVLDQLLYKWSHSRGVIAIALADQYKKLMESGWKVTRGEVRRDVKKLFGGSYLEFMSKSLV